METDTAYRSPAAPRPGSMWSYDERETLGKPVGCTMRPEGCLYPMHPWKRAHLDNDPTAPCFASRSVFGVQYRCGLTHGHEGGCTDGFVWEDGKWRPMPLPGCPEPDQCSVGNRLCPYCSALLGREGLSDKD